MQVRTFHMEHLKAMRLQPSQAHRAAELTPEVLEFISEMEAYTALVDDRPMACCGLLPFHPGRSLAWAFIAEDVGTHLLGVTKAVRTFLDLRAPRRVEMYVDAGFEPGERWARMLGFQREGYLRAFDSNGGDQIMYARVRNV